MNPTYGISDAINQISRMSGQFSSLQQQNISPTLPDPKKNSKISIHKIKPLGSNPAITDYLHSRGISLNTAKDFCKEIYYSIGDKNYFGLGNKNDKGWAIRNRYWKGCKAQSISRYKNQSDHLCLFEGIGDLLGYVEMNKKTFTNPDFMVLNSLANLKAALPEIKNYLRVDLYLDRDKAGMEATEKLKMNLTQCLDRGEFIRFFNDLNDYWINRDQQVVKR